MECLQCLVKSLVSRSEFNPIGMSPRKDLRSSSEPVSSAVDRLWILFGRQVRDARMARGWSVGELAHRAGLSRSFVYLVEAGGSGSAEAAARIARALGRRAEMALIDPRHRSNSRPNLHADPVHSAMGEFETRHFRGLGISAGLDEPYQHYQFAGRADVLAWDLGLRALLHIENRTRFPDLQEMAGSYNAKRAYLAESLGERLGIRRWESQTHVIAALWSSEVMHVLRLRTESFRAICADPGNAFSAWWAGQPPSEGSTSTLVLLDPFASDRQRTFVGLDDALVARPRYRGYSDAAARALRRAD